MWIGLVIGGLVGGAQTVKAFARRHEPEPPNSRLKLPIMLLFLGGCIALGASGDFPVLFAAVALLIAIEIAFILAGRNPWWMQGAIDKREYQSSPERRVPGA